MILVIAVCSVQVDTVALYGLLDDFYFLPFLTIILDSIDLKLSWLEFEAVELSLVREN